RIFAEEIGTDAYVMSLDAPPGDVNSVSASAQKPGGHVRADIRLEGPQRSRIREVLITGDFFITPPRTILDLEAALRGLDADAAGPAVEAFFARTPTGMASLTPADFREVIDAALSQRPAR
ncbi:MAG: hypothetical protein ACM3N5_05550, partial [Candidatus Eiseniibacteriota bacterium]